jgi:hypothetical protein
MPVDDREIVGLHPLRPWISDLIPVAVAVSGRLQTVRRSGLFQGPWAAGDISFGRRSILRPTNVIFIGLCRAHRNAQSNNP